MSFYMVVNNDKCIEYFSDNTAHHFKIKLDKELSFEGVWFVGLVDVIACATLPLSEHRRVLICCDICVDTYVDGNSLPLLRRLVLNGDLEYTPW